MSATATAATTWPTSFPASITSQFNYLPPGYPVQWSSSGVDQYLAHAQSCWSTYTQWRSYSSSWNAAIEAAGISSQTSTSNFSTTYYFPTSITEWPTTSVSTYTLCDGSPRANVSPFTTVFTSTYVQVRPSLTTLLPTFLPNPCQPNADDCAIYYFKSNLGYFNDTSDTIQDLEAACGLPVDWPAPCIIQGGPAQLFYFPVATASEDLCATSDLPPYFQSAQSTGGPSAVTTLGHTFSVGSAYISFGTLYAGYRSASAPGGQGLQIGPTFSNTIFEFRSDEISTNCYGTFNPTLTTTAGFGLGTQLNFADLNYPVPATAYECQNQCMACSSYLNSADQIETTCLPNNPCATIWDNFNPLLAVPTRLRQLVPEWASCSFWDDRIANVIFDPPTALQRFSVAASASLPPWDTRSGPASVTATTTTHPEITATRTIFGAWTTVTLAVPTAGDTRIQNFTVAERLYRATPTNVHVTEVLVIETRTCFPGSPIYIVDGGFVVSMPATASTSSASSSMSITPGPTAGSSAAASTAMTRSSTSAARSRLIPSYPVALLFVVTIFMLL